MKFLKISNFSKEIVTKAVKTELVTHLSTCHSCLYTLVQRTCLLFKTCRIFCSQKWSFFNKKFQKTFKNSINFFFPHWYRVNEKFIFWSFLSFSLILRHLKTWIGWAWHHPVTCFGWRLILKTCLLVILKKKRDKK